MALSPQFPGEYKLPKLRKAIFWLSTALCVLTVGGFGYIMVVISNSTDIWQKVGFAGFTIIAGLIWVGISYAFLINNDKCANCGISIRDDYRYCSRCDLQKETELRNTTEPLHCIVPDCDEKIESVNAYKDHYLEKHEDESIAEGISRPSFSKIRITDALYIKKTMIEID